MKTASLPHTDPTLVLASSVQTTNISSVCGLTLLLTGKYPGACTKLERNPLTNFFTSYDNTVVYEETVPLPLDAESNPRGAGFVTEQKVLSTSTSLDLDPTRNRVFMIRNDKVINKTSQKPVTPEQVCHPSASLQDTRRD